MNPADDATPDLLLPRARAGDDEARGRLLELYRNYLRLLARSLIGGAMRIRLDPSDLVQEVFLKAHCEFVRFAGQGEPELVAWLQRLATQLSQRTLREPIELEIDLGPAPVIGHAVEQFGIVREADAVRVDHHEVDRLRAGVVENA